MIASALAVLRADDHLSVSAITTYLRCPAQYEHRYVLRHARRPPPSRAGVRLGSPPRAGLLLCQPA
jgi:hypothetical protein